jgi:hypothetical protein
VEHPREIDPTWEIGFVSLMVPADPRRFPPTLDWFNRLLGQIYPTTEVPLAIPKFSTDIPMVCPL